MKKKHLLIGLSAVIVCLLLPGSLVLYHHIQANRVVAFGVEGMAENEDRWDEFLTNCSAGKKDEVRMLLNGKTEVSIRYDGAQYYYSSDDGSVQVFPYLFDQSGRMSGAETDSRYIYLSKSQYTFEDISSKIFSSDFNDVFFKDYILLNFE